ncbi:alginate export family protein [Pseudoxanthomonas putridarboris]|uniref:Alginate export family protein n=1 Tax=Pseudoxanthomonas putridarboris TaxID=752605 RepID=A0ABU9IYF8_9GAMM
MASAAGLALIGAAAAAPPMDSCGDDASCRQETDRGTLAFAGEIRVRHQDYRPFRFGVGADDDAFRLARALASVDWRIGRWQAFAQLGAHAEHGRDGGPGRTDQSAADVQQAYLALREGHWTAWAGRQEIGYGSSRLISRRDGPNIRLAFDGLRLSRATPGYRIDLLALRPVDNRPGAFDDGSDTGQALWGLYATVPTGAAARGKLDVYWLGYQRDDARFGGMTGEETRQSFGLRAFGQQGGWDWNVEAVHQQGRFQPAMAPSLDVRAWTLASDTGFTFDTAPWTPRASIKVDVASGDADPADGRLRTFNALYPRASYFSESSLIAPANLIDVQPAVTWRPSERIEFTAGWDFVWKHRRADAVYTTPTPLTAVAGTAGTSRRIGDQIKLEGSYRPHPDWEIQLHLARFRAGPGLREAGGRDVDFVSTTVGWQW